MLKKGTNFICIKSGKCMTELTGFVKVNKGDKGVAVEDEHKGSVVIRINGSNVIIHKDHINNIVENSIFACFKTNKNADSVLESKKVKILIKKLEEVSGKKIVLKEV